MRGGWMLLVGAVACFDPPAPSGPRPGMPRVTRPEPDATPAPVVVEGAAGAPGLGQTVYETGGSRKVACATCHQRDGSGLPPSFPPLKGPAAVKRDCVQHAGIVVHGMSGEVVIGGVTYNGVMPAMGDLTDEEIAAVITYERTSWGNNAGACTVADVAAARARGPVQPP